MTAEFEDGSKYIEAVHGDLDLLLKTRRQASSLKRMHSTMQKHQ